MKSTISNFANFLIEEKEVLQRNPTRGIELPSSPLLWREQSLSPEQRSILYSLVEQAGDRRGAALFALGYWAGCRVSEVSWLQMEHTHVGPMDSLLKADPGAGQGLPSMRERVAHLGGTLQITSAPGKGAQIRVVIPLR